MRDSRRILSDISNVIDSSILKDLLQIVLVIKAIQSATYLILLNKSEKYSSAKALISWIKIILKNQKKELSIKNLFKS